VKRTEVIVSNWVVWESSVISPNGVQVGDLVPQHLKADSGLSQRSKDGFSFRIIHDNFYHVIIIGSVQETDYSKFLNAMISLQTSVDHRLCHKVVVRGAEGCFRPSQKPAGHSPLPTVSSSPTFYTYVTIRSYDIMPSCSRQQVW